MLLARRHRPPFRERLMSLVWPRRSFARSLRYCGLRLLRQSVAPDVLARGVAVGLFAATLPIFGLQMITALALAIVVRGHVPAALLATFWANPVTIPVMAAISYWTGAAMLGLDAQHVAGNLEALVREPLSAATVGDGVRAVYGRLAPIFEPLLIGAVPLAIVTGAVGYGAVYAAMSQARRSRGARAPSLPLHEAHQSAD